MSEIKFTREELGHFITYAGRGGYASQPQGRLAAFALTLLDRAERAERELREAEEATRLLVSDCIDRALDRKGEG